jgi:hypothetical protein
MIVMMRYTISARAIKPTIAFSISILSLDLLTGPDEEDHQAKETDRGENIKDIRHGTCILTMASCPWAGCLERSISCLPS